MSGEGDIYYTLRKAGAADKATFELAKWREDECRPLDTYTMWLPVAEVGGGGKRKFLSCNCPSRSQPCKHWNIAQALLEGAPFKADAPFEHLPRLLWQEGRVLSAQDIPDDAQVAKLFDY